MERVFREVIEEWLSWKPPPMVERELEVPLETGLATAVIGPRRAGKTYLLYQLAVRHGRSLYINFEDVRFVGLRPRDFSVFLKTLAEHGDFNLLLLDEVQNVPHWGRWIRSLLDRGYLVAVAGSTSKLGAREVPTELRGRYLSRLLLPFSFREYLKAVGIPALAGHAPASRGRLLGALREYLERGGYPEAVLRPQLARELLRTYRDTVVYRDVVERHRVRDARGFEVFLSMVESSFCNVFSISSAHRRLASLGLEKSKKTLANYLKYLEEAFYVVAVPKWGPGKTPLTQPHKIYPVDPGYIPEGQIGRKMEAAVAVELLRRGAKFYYYRGRREVDFVVEGEPPLLIQVTYASAPDEVDRRELDALSEAAAAVGGRPLLITWDLEGQIARSGLRVDAVPLWQWLLGGWAKSPAST
ncbi:conserved hypothetical protein [Pyrobaculum islandicum DSM 4184]|uniref:Uncharacterized protein n=1 Tax=Pyrobaculum islandicum (strain DSM 4184 / JCM 9189 / GEO3) TaxID=384616 RepID=A1RQY0_PYRIL|nr:ATP-binding protein [Pyrobaculum islandicum]ABL87362.1 conserved hypothetical protein [Pyrobaculum islandicum DSM 4184]